MDTAAIVAALALPRAAWCRLDGGHWFGVRMALGEDSLRELLASGDHHAVADWFGQTGNGQLPLLLELLDQGFVRRRPADLAGRLRALPDGRVELHAAFVMLDVDVGQPLDSPRFGDLWFDVVDPIAAPAWLHHAFHVFATRPWFLVDWTAACWPPPGQLPEASWIDLPANLQPLHFKAGETWRNDPLWQQAAAVRTRDDLVLWLEAAAARSGVHRDLWTRLARSLDHRDDLGVDPEATGLAWWQLASWLWPALRPP